MTAFDVLLAGVAVLAAGIAAITGFGIGSLLTPLLATSIGTKSAVAVVAIPHVAATAFRLWALRAEVDRSVLRTFGVASAAGGLAGAVLQASLGGPILAVILGVLLVFAGLSELTGLARTIRFPGASSIAAGALSGVFGGLVGNQGGIRSAALLRFELTPRQLVATATASALLVDAARIPIYVATSGAQIAGNARTVALLVAAVLVGTALGAPILRRLPDPIFRRLLSILLIVLGVTLIVGVGR